MKISKKKKYRLLGNCKSVCRVVKKDKKNELVTVSIYAPTSWDPMPFNTGLTVSFDTFRKEFREITQ